MVAVLLTLFALLAPKQHIAVAPGASATSVKPGATISLRIDVTPDPGIHVYAPGAKDYEPIAVVFETPAGVSVGAVTYPKADVLSFDGESVPVFQKPFRLEAEMSVPKAAKAGTKLTVTARVDYQACDDKVCFIPASLPVSWTIDVKAGK
jgi:DsbC/DsbD-like thiol-disulfide interchange protein